MKKFITHTLIYTTLLISSISLISCNKYLDVEPSKSSSKVVSTVEDLDALLNNHSQFSNEVGATRLFGTDDFEIVKSLYDASAGAITLQNYQFALWDTQYTPETGDRTWTTEYRKIFTANLVLSSLSKVSGSAEDKERLKLDAHFIRAYSYWILANTYCLPYSESTKNELGLPIKTSTSFEEDLSRAPLSKVYELINSDLQEALRITLPMLQNGVQKSWRANVAAVNAFAARYYLHLGNYEEAEKYASLSLSAYNVLVDYNSEMSVGMSFPVTLDAGTANQRTFTVDFPSTVLGNTALGLPWKEFTYFRTQNVDGLLAAVSSDLADQYDKTNDLRFVYHNVEGFTYVLPGLVKPSYGQSSYVFFGYNAEPSGMTVAETILNKAEALARLGRFADAITTANILRVKRIKSGTPNIYLTASNKAEAITKILQERRREMPFSQRWFDLRRLNHNDDPNDDKEITKTFYEFDGTRIYTDRPLKNYVLSPKSRKYAVPVPATEIIASGNIIKQNTY